MDNETPQTPNDGTPVVELRDVNKHFDDLHVLRDVNLSVRKGEVVVILGPSGSGKSTLCRTINRLETIDSGTILFHGEPLPTDPQQLSTLRTKVGMVFQSFNLFDEMTALENVMFGPTKVLGVAEEEARSQAMELLSGTGMAEQADKHPAELSGGQQQRVAIARSLAMQPEVMLFDEPTSALDPHMVHEVLDVMTGLADSGMTMVVVTHEMAFARKAADRVIFLADGQILADTDPQTFFSHPDTEQAREFLGELEG